MAFAAEHYVALGFVVFVAIMMYLGVQHQIVGALDARIARVKKELSQAEELRAEAAKVLEGYKQKAAEARAEAQAIVAQAKAEAEMLAKETEQRMAEFVARRTKQAEEKIATAEAQAAADVKSAAADAAVRAAETVLKEQAKAGMGRELLARSVQEMKQRLN